MHRTGQIALSVVALLIVLPLTLEPLALWVVSSDRVVDGLIGVVYGARTPETPPGAPRVKVHLDGQAPVAEVDDAFLSFAIDTSQVVGGHWWSESAEVELKKGRHRTEPFDFDRPRLQMLSRALAPAYLRIGGTEADDVTYDLDARDGATTGDATTGDGESDAEALMLTRQRWDAVGRFAEATGLRLFFTANAGDYDRVDGAWTGRHLKRLLEYTRRRGYPVDVWELGNEVNVYWFTQGLRQHVSAERYADDYRRFSKLVRSYFPEARVAATGAFLWPVMGEPPPLMLPKLLRSAGGVLDVITWHYYPQQSRRCWSATRRARPGLLLEPTHLDEFERWAGHVERLRDRHAPDASVWLGESGGAQCGGEPGISDRYESSLWWLDQLGLAARRGQPVAVRQTLAGSHYGMIDAQTLEPRPDYWGSLLWKRLMGTRALQVEAPGNRRLRSYAQCTAPRAGAPEGSATLLLVNLDAEQSLQVELEEELVASAQVYAVTAKALDAEHVELNGQALRIAGDRLPDLVPTNVEGDVLELAPASYTFVVLPEADLPACRSADVPTAQRTH